MNTTKLTQGTKIMWGSFIGQAIIAILTRGRGLGSLLLLVGFIGIMYGAYMVLSEKNRSYAWLVLVFFFNLIGVIVVHFLHPSTHSQANPSH